MNSSKIHIILSLLKYKVTLAVTFTSITGYLILSGEFDLNLLFLACGVFLLAGGASAFNQIQERKQDACMERTAHRPLPSGKINSKNAIRIALISSATGLIILYFFLGIIPFMIGLFNLLWYNLLYTNLKKVTSFAVVPGSLTGALPVFIGWTAAGGFLLDKKIILIGLFLFIWQIPHFWLLIMKYNNQYEKAGFPSVYKTLNRENFRFITLIWIIATSVVSVMFPVFNIINSVTLNLSIIILNIIFVIIFTKLTFVELSDLNFKKSFVSMNAYMVLFMLFLIIYFVLSN